MDEVYALEVISKVIPGSRVTILGRIDSREGEFLVLNDTTGAIRVNNVPLDAQGMMEVRGVCRQPGIVEAIGFTLVRGEVDIEDHLKLVEMYRNAPLLG